MIRVNLSLLLGSLLVVFVGCGGDDDKTGADISETGCATGVDCPPEPPTLEQIKEKLENATVEIKTSKIGTSSGWGSGFLIDDVGHIVTNNHVAVGASELRVSIEGEDRLINAKPIAYAECADLAVLQLTEDTNAPYLEWYGKDVTSGMAIASAGFPSDVLNNSGEPIYTYTDGVVNTKSYFKGTAWAYTKAFNHSAKIAPGNSGGPLIELSTGKVVGINYAGNSKNDRQSAISAKTAQTYIDKMLQGENINSIGISPEVVFFNGNAYGVKVEAVTAGGKASKIGIKRGDTIDRLGGSKLWKALADEYDPRITTLEKYCSILKSQNPNGNEGTGAVISIEISRTIQDALIMCKGEINGESLTLNSDSSQPCPE